MAIGKIKHGAFHKFLGKKHKSLYGEGKHESKPIHGPRHDKGRKLYG